MNNILKYSKKLFMTGLLTLTVGFSLGVECQPAIAAGNVMHSAYNGTIIDVAKKVRPSVVTIYTVVYGKKRVPNADDLAALAAAPWEKHRVGTTEKNEIVGGGTGSGVIYDAVNGYIMTNNHVVAGAKTVKVMLNNGRQMKGTVLGTDPISDLAVVKVDEKGLPSALLGDSSKLQVGELAIAIGSPAGFKDTVSAGIIGGLDKSAHNQYYNFIQTDAAINHGNSGGALINAAGEVIGIPSRGEPGYTAVSFAIPINTAKPILKELVEHGRVNRAYLGVAMLDERSALELGYDFDFNGGVMFTHVYNNGSAATAGIQRGDIVLEFNGVKTTTMNSLKEQLIACRPGDTVNLKMVRNGIPFNRNVVLKGLE